MKTEDPIKFITKIQLMYLFKSTNPRIWPATSSVSGFYYSMELIPSSEATSCSATPEFPRNSKVHYRAHKISPFSPNLC
jgi:hypothetical protein